MAAWLIILTGQGLGVDPGTHPGLVVSGVTFIDVGQDGTGNDDCIVIPPNFTDFVITGNRCTDDQAVGTMRFGLAIQSGDNNYTVTGNNFTSLLRPKWLNYLCWWIKRHYLPIMKASMM